MGEGVHRAFGLGLPVPHIGAQHGHAPPALRELREEGVEEIPQGAVGGLAAGGKEQAHVGLNLVVAELDHVDATTVRLLPQAFVMLRDVLAVRRRSATSAYGLSDPLTADR